MHEQMNESIIMNLLNNENHSFSILRKTGTLKTPNYILQTSNIISTKLHTIWPCKANIGKATEKTAQISGTKHFCS
jgi:hypothetical protein